MIEAPKQKWALYEAECRQEHVEWLRRLSPVESMALCAELRRLASTAPAGTVVAERLEQHRWEEKLARRKRMIAAFQAWDRNRRE